MNSRSALRSREAWERAYALKPPTPGDRAAGKLAALVERESVAA